MSERYRACPKCLGRGKVYEPILLRDEECPRCLGTGDSGEALERPEPKEEHLYPEPLKDRSQAW